MTALRTRLGVALAALAAVLPAAHASGETPSCPTRPLGERLLAGPPGGDAFLQAPFGTDPARGTGAVGKVGLSALAWTIPGGTPRCGEWAADGFRSVRVDVMWKDVERDQGVYDWSSTDATIATLSRAGLTVLPVLDTTAPAYQSIPGEPFSPPTNVDAYAAWAAAFVERYGPGGSFWAGHRGPAPVDAVELWNEPYGTAFWRTGPDVGQYRDLFVAAATAVRAADPRVKIGLEVNPKFRPLGSGRDEDWARPLLEDPTVEPLTDFLSVHPYSRPDAADPAADADAVYGFAMVAGIHATALAAGWRDPRVWITEVGFPAALGDQRQAGYNAAAIARAFGEWGTFVDRYFLFTPGNTGSYPEEIFRPGTTLDRGSYAAVVALLAAGSG
jgi:hypothetical protein